MTGRSAVAGLPRQVESPDGTLIGVVEYRPPEGGSRGLPALFVPALGVPIGYYEPMLSGWAEAGRRVVAVELRGMPLSPVSAIRRQRYGYSTLITDDLPAVVAALGLEADGFVAAGHSLGGQLSLLAAARRSIRPASVVAIASGTSSAAACATTLARARRRAQVELVGGVSRLLGYWPGDRLRFGGRQPTSLMRDWYVEGAHGRYRLHGDSTDYETGLGALPLPILLLSLDGDSVIPRPAVEHLQRRLPAHTEHRHLERPGAAGYEHIRWARRGWTPIVETIDSWA